ncbi:MAG: peptidase [Planctomycetes bacterium]|nr:peptidase [Planctomycetota bacterium]
MKRSKWQTTLLLAIVLAVAPGTLVFAARARARRGPAIGYAYPAGGRQGTTFEVAIAGRFLDGVTDVVTSGQGIRATVIEHVKPLNGKQINLLRDRLKELQKKVKPLKKGKGKKTTDDQANTDNEPVTEKDLETMEKEMAEIREKLANPKNRNRSNPQLSEDVTLRIVLAPDAEPGERELRLKTAQGLSNPVAFYVGQLPEYAEKETKNKTEDTEVLSELPIVINGQIMPGDVDRFRLKLSKGARLVMAASARELTPYLADAVPGWFQATLALYDANGEELAYADDYRFHPDPVLFYEIPQDGQYVLEIKDAIYRGREDFVYRITVGEMPFVTSIFPLGGKVGAQTTVRMKGWNLPTDKLTMDANDKEPGILPLSLRKDELVSNRVPFAVDTLPECMETESNNNHADAQKITLPVIVNGRIDKPGDWDVFGFKGNAGDKIVAEVYARRLNSPLDSLLKLTNANGKKLIANDDHEDKGAGLTTHHADSLLSTTLPTNGFYYIHIGDAQTKGGAAYGYRLRIGPPRPDFELRVVPSSINARGGATVPLTVYALRKDGFTGDIAVTLKDAPKGFTLNGRRVPAGKDQMRLTLKVPPGPIKKAMSLSLEGRAEIQGRQVVRQAIPADDMMQAFIYRHLVCAKDLKVAVIGRAKPKVQAKKRNKKTVTSTPVKKRKPNTNKSAPAKKGSQNTAKPAPKKQTRPE